MIKYEDNDGIDISRHHIATLIEDDRVIELQNLGKANQQLKIEGDTVSGPSFHKEYDLSTVSGYRSVKIKVTWQDSGFPTIAILEAEIFDSIGEVTAPDREYNLYEKAYNETPKELVYVLNDLVVPVVTNLDLTSDLKAHVEQNLYNLLSESTTTKEFIDNLYEEIHQDCNSLIRLHGIIYDAMLMAVNQVQDIRLDNLENPKIETKEFVFELLMGVALTSGTLWGGAMSLAGGLIKRAFCYAAKSRKKFSSTAPFGRVLAKKRQEAVSLLKKEKKAGKISRSRYKELRKNAVPEALSVTALNKEKQEVIKNYGDIRAWIKLRNSIAMIAEDETPQGKNTKKIYDLFKKTRANQASGNSSSRQLISLASKQHRDEIHFLENIKSAATLTLSQASHAGLADLVIEDLLNKYTAIAHKKMSQVELEFSKDVLSLQFEHDLLIFMLVPKLSLTEFTLNNFITFMGRTDQESFHTPDFPRYKEVDGSKTALSLFRYFKNRFKSEYEERLNPNLEKSGKEKNSELNDVTLYAEMKKRYDKMMANISKGKEETPVINLLNTSEDEKQEKDN